MPEKKWTESQLNAINSREGTVLVSAAAGSGKTAVLVQRAIERIIDENNPCDADKLLIVTFTKAAATEVKNRISKKISELIDENPSNYHLRKQQILISKSHISTIHSFCSEIIRENFYKLNISKDFKIADSGKMTILKDEALQFAVEKLYDSESEKINNFLEFFSSGKDDTKLINIISTLYDFVRSHSFPDLWLDGKLKMYECNNNLSDCEWAKVIFNYAVSALDYSLNLTKNSLSLSSENETLKQAYKGTLLSDMDNLINLRESLNSCDWDNISKNVTCFEFQKLKPVRGFKDNPVKLKICNNRDEVKSTIKKITKLFFLTENMCIEDIRSLHPIVKILFNTVKTFSSKLDELKTLENLVDFSDLEHFMIKLLVNVSGNNKYTKSDFAKTLSEKFDEIMVDEYQDTNEIQDIIFSYISKNEENLFLVGDAKQSIYRFRQAMPELFLKRKEKYKAFNTQSINYPAKIILGKNFRSRSNVIDTVNFIFSQLMSKEVGQIEYNDEEKLFQGANFEKEYLPDDTRLDIIDISKSEEKNIDVDIIEAKHISTLILEMIKSGYKIKDGNSYRPVTYGDFCILLRSANKHAATYANEIKLNAIPVWSDISGSFFDTNEISVIISLLKVIDTPIQDIPVLSVLFSPIFAFTPDKISQIKLSNKDIPLYFAIKELSDNGDKECSNFIEQIEEYRYLSAVMPSDRLIDYIYNKTGYIHMVQTMPDGNRRVANLRLFMEYAKKYGESGNKNVSGFIKFIEKLKSKNSDLVSASTTNENSNTVKIMSIHRSKGLEFPICIIAGCSRKFNMDNGDILLHPSLGLGIKLRTYDNMVQYTTMIREAIKIETENDSISEELRILYVAATRAKGKLIFVSSVKNLEKTLKKLSIRLTDSKKIPPYVVKSANSFSDWLLYCALKHPNGSKLRNMCDLCISIQNDKSKLSVNVINENLVFDTETLKKPETTEYNYDEKIIKELDKRFNFVYPNSELTNIPNKVSASSLSIEKDSDIEYLKRPHFVREKSSTPQEKGTAIHAFMQFANYARAKDNLENEIATLVRKGFLSLEQKHCLDLEKIKKFLNSSLLDRILSSNNVLREYRFTVNVPIGMIYENSENNRNIILQGAIDCAFEEKGQFVIVDYKTGMFKSSNDLVSQYSIQLNLYKYALEKCKRKKVSECLIYSFYDNQINNFC